MLQESFFEELLFVKLADFQEAQSGNQVADLQKTQLNLAVNFVKPKLLVKQPLGRRKDGVNYTLEICRNRLPQVTSLKHLKSLALSLMCGWPVIHLDLGLWSSWNHEMQREPCVSWMVALCLEQKLEYSLPKCLEHAGWQ